MATSSFLRDTFIDKKEADILISQIEKSKNNKSHEPIIDIKENMKEGRVLLKKLILERKK